MKALESEYRDLAWVPRWSIIRVNRRQSVAEHCFYVALYGLDIAQRLHWGDSEQRERLVEYLLRHDEVECLESDIPGPAKRLGGYDGTKMEALVAQRLGPHPKFDADMRRIRQTADLIDECLYLSGEIASGNRAVVTALESAQARLDKAVDALRSLVGVFQERIDYLATYITRAIANEQNGHKDLNGVNT